MFDLEEGFEVQIPADLSQSKLPHSFRYYDPVLAMIKENVSDQILKKANTQNDISYNIHSKNDYLNIFKDNFILGTDKKLTFSTKPLNAVSDNQIDHMKSCYAMQIQRSRYLKIDKNIHKNHILKQRAFQKFDEVLATDQDEFDKPHDLNENLNGFDQGIKLYLIAMQNVTLLFCPIQQVKAKYQHFLNEKAKFLVKILKLKNQG